MSKRFFDFFFSLFGLVFLMPLLLAITIVAALDTGSSGLFFQQRVGRLSKLFLDL